MMVELMADELVEMKAGGKAGHLVVMMVASMA